MKALIGFVLIFLSGSLSLANSEVCQDAAEHAAWKAWYDPSAWSVGGIQHGATDVIWERNGVISYQVSVMHRKPDSSTISWANYSVRVRTEDCAVLKVRKF